MAILSTICGFEILDSRGNPTVVSIVEGRFAPDLPSDYLTAWVERYPILTIEDGRAEDEQELANNAVYAGRSAFSLSGFA